MVNKPVENPTLLAELRKRESVGNDVNAMTMLMNNIMQMVATEATFLAIINWEGESPEPTGDGQAVVKEGTIMQVQLLSSTDGTTYLPLFTDWPSLRQWDAFKDARVNTLMLKFDDIMPFIKDNVAGIVINPFSENLCITAPQLRHMQQVKGQGPGVVAKKVEKETTVQISEPVSYPPEFTEAICNYAKSDARITAVYFTLMRQNQDLSYLLVVDCDGDFNNFFSGIARACKAYVPAGISLQMVPLNTGFGKQVAQKDCSKLVYSK